MMVDIKMVNGSRYVSKVKIESLDDILKLVNQERFLKIEHSSGPILLNVANISDIKRAQ